MEPIYTSKPTYVMNDREMLETIRRAPDGGQTEPTEANRRVFKLWVIERFG